MFYPPSLKNLDSRIKAPSPPPLTTAPNPLASIKKPTNANRYKPPSNRHIQ